MQLSTLLASYQDYFKDENGKHYDYPDVWTSFAKSALTQVFLWSLLAIALVLLAVGLFVRFKNAEKLKAYLHTAIALFVGLCVTVIIAMLALEFLDMQESGAVFTIVLVPSLVSAGAVLLGAAAIYVGTLYSKKVQRATLIASLSVMGGAFIALMVCLGVYFAKGDAENNNGATITLSENIALYLCAVALIAAIALFAFFFGRKDKKGYDSKSISYAAVCVAMSFALSYIRLWKMPQGGSITLASLLPLMLYSYMFGVRKGVVAGFAYGLLQAVQDPWIIHPAQFLLDYPVAFAAIGLAGLFSRMKKLEKLPQVQFALGAIAASLLRFLAHVLSGVFAFSEYSTLDNVWLYSMAYNSFVFVDVAVIVVAGVLALCSPSIVKAVRKFHPKEIAQTAEEQTETE